MASIEPVMKLFSSVHDVTDINALAAEALQLKHDPLARTSIWASAKKQNHRLVFLNPSSGGIRMPSQAALNLGMNGNRCLNIDKEGWVFRAAGRAIMQTAQTVEHIRAGSSRYGQDIMGALLFPGFEDRDEDYSEAISRNSGPIVKLVVPLNWQHRHPLQSLAGPW